MRSVDEAAQEVERQAKAAGTGDLGTENLLRSVRELRRVRPPPLHSNLQVVGCKAVDDIRAGLLFALAVQLCV